MTPYTPSPLPITNLDWKRLISLVGKANASLSQYNGLLESMINPHVLLSPLTMKEATLSSKIEGTQATLSEVLKYEVGEVYNAEKERDIQEIWNYRKAMLKAEELIKKDESIHLNMIKSLHKILLDGVRGANKARGEFRTDQNWIGAAGCSIQEATFVPPNPIDMNIALTNWENYLNNEDEDILIQLAVVHAQFEMIHPFKDGNGRIGRILIPLFLYMKKYLNLPVFYLSEYLEENREAYYAHLNAISQQGKWQEWIEFFLNAVIVQSAINTEKAKTILELYDRMKEKIQKVTHSQYAVASLDAIFAQPIMNSTTFLEKTKIDRRGTANAILNKLVEEDVLTITKKGVGRSPSRYVFMDLIQLVDDRV